MSLSPREVNEALLSRIAAGEWDSLEELYAEDAVIVLPFEGRRLEGREDLRGRVRRNRAAQWDIEVANLVVYDTADPEVIVTEWDFRGTVKATGETFELANVRITRVRDGLIVESRDYHNTAALPAA
ncbi:nuclear transport factor 2 family protein [Actinosynnema sp. NPDC020468]|uniref:nuclear transport factor 2 family protein n=1 Tax=Actinosynnema sp. NPDC020468 TaxID=3154488 RepID=UPI0033C2523A